MLNGQVPQESFAKTPPGMKTSLGMRLRRTPAKTRLAAALVWIVLALAAASSAAALNYYRLSGFFDADARTLHRILSQRADQHDAHLTSLAALLASPDESFKTLRAVAEAVLRFYPRIKAIEVLTIGNRPEVTFTTRSAEPTLTNMGEIASLGRALLPGQTALASGGGSETYQLVKGLPESNAQKRVLVMSVDARRLADPEGMPTHEVELILKSPSGVDIVRTGKPAPASLSGPAFEFEKVLGSLSQPLLLTITRRPPMLEILPPIALAMAAAGAAVCVLLGLLVMRERRAAREARERASFHEQEARLAHAMRVNTVGEMASGIAHELTQPLTAILSQSQAGARLARASAPDREAIIGVLDANARLAKRAGDILSRLRAYVSNKAPVSEATDLNEAVSEAVEMVRDDLSRRGVTLVLDLSNEAPVTLIDRVCLEQVVHNLVRNAADAVEHLQEESRVVTIVTAKERDAALISVQDSGAGISADSLPRVFEPFFTTKGEGMGLGLSICERLVEAHGGQISVANRPSGGAAFTVRLPLSMPVTKGAAA
jgi:two-component system sensor kinase FixL